jgi:hypothetical protein
VLFQDPDDIRLKAPIPSALPTKNLIEDSIRISLEYYYKEGVENERKYSLIDIDGKEITPTELAEKYFSSPEECFIKDDETLKAENVARNMASVSNNLYSQIIRRKITPLACNTTSLTIIGREYMYVQCYNVHVCATMSSKYLSTSILVIGAMLRD